MYQLTRVLISASFAGLALPALTQAQSGMELPDGEGRELVQGLCTACHQTNLITGSVGYTEEDWRYVVGTMIQLSEPVASNVAGYLAANFPPSGERKPVLVPGDEVVTFEEWTVPTLGQRARDPFMHTDGSIWWAGMFANLVGRLNPETGGMTEYRIDARPHTVIQDFDSGDVWYTGNSNGTMGRIDAGTGEITTYPMPDPDARDPHSAMWALDGSLWFTLQNSNMLGRLNPDTGDVWLTDMPTERAQPYGIRRDAEGNLWIAYRGAYKIARVDPETREITEYETPNYGRYSGLNEYIRRLAISEEDGMVWYVDSGRGELGRFNPRTGEFDQWPSPSGVDSHPYAIEVVDGIVWYNESNQRPDALVRFDPETETFQSWAIPSGIGIIRNMRETPDGNLVIHQSSTNTVGLVRIGESNET